MRMLQDTLVTVLDDQPETVSLLIGRDRGVDYLSGFRPSNVPILASALRRGS